MPGRNRFPPTSRFRMPRWDWCPAGVGLYLMAGRTRLRFASLLREFAVKSFFRNLPYLGFSVLINLSVLASLYFIHRSLPAFAKELTLESIFTEEMPQEEMTRELQLDTAPAETLNTATGSIVSVGIFQGARNETARSVRPACQPQYRSTGHL